MNRWLFILAALAALVLAANSEKKIVCYYGSWAVYRQGAGKFLIADFPPQLCTHMIYSFVGISEQGDVVVLDAWNDLPADAPGGGMDGYNKFNNLRKQSPNTKTLIAIGGWNEGSTKFSDVVSNAAIRSTFVQNVVAFVQKYGFDGFDIDWEYPNQRGGKPTDLQNYILLLQELRTEFDKHGFILSAPVAAAQASASQSYNIPEISKYLDFINVMAYDLHGTWESVTGENSPLYGNSGDPLTVDASVRYWLNSGCPAEKLVLGVPFYGHAWTLANNNQHGIGAPTAGPGNAGPYTAEGGTLGYNEICESFKQGGWTIVRDQEQQVPYAYKGNQWVGYDDVQSLTAKMNYVNSMNLGGAMTWSIETDDFHGNCGEAYPLLKTMNAVLRGGVPVVPTQPTDPTGPTEKPTQPTQPTPPPSGICKKPGYVRDAKDCSVFYNCVVDGNGYDAIRFSCPNGLVFDPSINACNYKDDVPGC